MAHLKGLVSVYDACSLVYEKMPNKFHMIIFVMEVRRICGRPALPDGTILRKLRQLRADHKLNYKCINNDIAIYEKL